jgi:hypothetical protein
LELEQYQLVTPVTSAVAEEEVVKGVGHFETITAVVEATPASKVKRSNN